MPDEHPGDETAPRAAESSDLLSDLEVIESQPLARRAESYEALHDALARRLESGPTADGRP